MVSVLNPKWFIGWRQLGAMVCVMLCLLPSSLAWSLVAKATVDTTQLGTDDSVQFEYSIDEAGFTNQPDFSPLQQDFKVLNMTQQHLTRMINGTTSASTTWRVTLRPKRAGTLVIPPISFDGVSSKPITLTVRDDRVAPKARGDQLVWLDMQVDRTSAFVQQQVIVTLSLYQRTVTHDPVFTWPEGDGYIREKLGDARVYQKVVDGHEYSVTENRFAIFPQKSGTLTLPAAEFTAFIAMGSSSMFDPFLNTTGKQITRYSPPVDITVMPKPADYPADAAWLPAREVVMEDSLTPDKRVFKTGEPITRKIILQAFGIARSVLPPLPAPEGDGYKLYPEKGKTADGMVDGHYVSQRLETHAIIPTKAGTLTLPPIEVIWWNTRTGKVTSTTLPARTLTIEAAPAPADNPAPVAAPAQSSTVTGTDTAPPSVSGWPLIAAVLGVLWLLTLAGFAWLWKRRQPRAARTPVAAPEEHAAEARKALMSACMQHHAPHARRALIQWFRKAVGPDDIRSLGDVAEYAMSALLVRAALDLQTALYSPRGGQWNGDALRKALADEESQRRIKQRETRPALAPLYPT